MSEDGGTCPAARPARLMAWGEAQGVVLAPMTPETCKAVGLCKRTEMMPDVTGTDFNRSGSGTDRSPRDLCPPDSARAYGVSVARRHQPSASSAQGPSGHGGMRAARDGSGAVSAGSLQTPSANHRNARKAWSVMSGTMIAGCRPACCTVAASCRSVVPKRRLDTSAVVAKGISRGGR